MSKRTCDDCALTWDRKNNVKDIVLCPLHRAAPDLLDALERIGAVFDFTEPLEPGAFGIRDTGYINTAFALADTAIGKAHTGDRPTEAQ